jgi:hypothetical protein
MQKLHLAAPNLFLLLGSSIDPEANRWYQSQEASRSNLPRTTRNDGRLVGSPWICGRQDVVGIRWKRWQRRLRTASCEGGWRQASKLANSHPGELHRVGTDHEDQAVSKESLGRHRDRRCHIVGGSHGAGCDHQRGAAEDAGIASGEEERHGGVGGGQVPKVGSVEVFCDTSTGAATRVARCGSLVGKAFSLLVVSSR